MYKRQGLAGFGVGVYLLNKHGPAYSFERSIEASFLLLCTFLPMLLYDHPLLSASPYLADPSLVLSAALPRALIKLLGMLLSFAAAAAAYWLFEEYHASFMSAIFLVDERIDPPPDTVPYYHNFFRLFRLLHDLCRGPLGLLALAFSVLFLSELVAADSDGFFHTGAWALSRLRAIEEPPGFRQEALGQHFLASLVQFFYAPLMFGYLCENLSGLHYKPWTCYLSFWRYANNIIFSVDVSFAAIGYFCNSSLLHNQIRSTEPTALGWVSALACYQPFFHLLTSSYIDYTRNPPWNEWISELQIAHQQLLLKAYGAVILLLQAMFVWCTMSFGLRYSNLTFRGVVDSGPYYFTKHPAYIVKILAFAMISVPWVDLRRNAGVGRNFRNVATLLLLAGLYYLRAYTEELHLSQASPLYQQYSASIDDRHQRWFSTLVNFFGQQAENP